MIIDILRHTPPWVFAIFVALVVLGVRRLRASTMDPRRLLVLPVAMTALSVVGLCQAFGANAVALAAWSAAFVAVLAVCWLLPPQDGVHLVDRVRPAGGVQYSATPASPAVRDRIHVPGSALPLILMMTIFFLRYGVAVSLAMDHALRTQTAFVAIVGALYGLSSGAFAARALRTWRSAFGRASAHALVVAS